MKKLIKNKRIIKIRKSLQYGDVSKIAEKAGVTREWVSYVLLEKGISERILEVAEEHLRSKNTLKKNTTK